MLKIGHRGASGLAPENTKAAFKEAIATNMDMIELDVQLSKDNKLVVFHDYDLTRIAGIEQKISQLTLKELKEIDVGSWYQDKYKAERILTLKEVINLVRGRLKINIELKPLVKDYDLISKRVIKLLEETDFKEEVVISSFNHPLVKHFKTLAPEIKTGILIIALPVKPVAVIEAAKADMINPHHLAINQQLVKEVKDAGYQINAWTVNQPAEVARLKSLGVDGIMTDYPELLN